MSIAYQTYVITLLVYLGVNAIAVWALNLQYAYAGILNFAFIMFQAAGAYSAAVLTLGPSTGATFQSYFFGASLPFPLPWLGAAAVGAVLALLIGAFAMRPARRDFQAMVMLVVSIIAATLVVSEGSWFNGQRGLAFIPHPFFHAAAGNFASPGIGYQWFYVGLTFATCVVVYLLVHLITSSPWGRRLRAMRDNPEAIESLGVNIRRESLKVFMLGGAIASLSGAILVQYIGSWSPGSWATPETFLYLAAVIVGGAGNNFGVTLGAALVLGVFMEVVLYLPNFGGTGVAEAIQFMLIGVLILGFLYWRPQGLIPERRRRFGLRAPDAPPPQVVPPAQVVES
jgi:branched-chain amino acid transport system permease protein